jgi:uncharacterized protein YdhG (YjbR/CyaY superfamily)
MPQATKSTGRTGADGKGFSAAEKAAMRERARELKAEQRADADRAVGEAAVLEKIAEMPADDRAMAERIHAIVAETAPTLSPKTYYGMPAYARDGKIVLFFTPAAKFKERYATLGFNAEARLDEGSMWPTSWALTDLNAPEEARIVELIKKAVG